MYDDDMQDIMVVFFFFLKYEGEKEMGGKRRGPRCYEESVGTGFVIGTWYGTRCNMNGRWVSGFILTAISTPPPRIYGWTFFYY